MSIARFQGSHRRLVRHFNGGATVEMRTPHTLENGSTGAKLTALVVNGTIAAGATSGDFDATSISEGGVLPKGCKLTIDGNEYTTTAAVTAASDALASVQFTPGAVAEIADDTAATISQDYGSASYPARRGQFMQRDIDGETIRLDDFFLRVATTDEISEDALVVWDGSTYSVVAVQPFKPGESQGSAKVVCRG